jgi:hypothetical protein
VEQPLRLIQHLKKVVASQAAVVIDIDSEEEEKKVVEEEQEAFDREPLEQLDQLELVNALNFQQNSKVPTLIHFDQD